MRKRQQNTTNKSVYKRQCKEKNPIETHKKEHNDIKERGNQNVFQVTINT